MLPKRIIFFRLFILFIIAYCSFDAFSREALTLNFKVEIQEETTEHQWVTRVTKNIIGLDGVQSYLNPANTYRMVLTVQKPHDLKAIFKVRTPIRFDGIEIPAGVGEGKIILGPQSNCTNDMGKRCLKLSLDDVGYIELSVVSERAAKAAIGYFSYRPFDVPEIINVRPLITYAGKEVLCESSVAQGWWIFSKKFQAQDSLDTISLCITNPKGHVSCIEDGEHDVDVHASQEGPYLFQIWNDHISVESCTIYAK